MESKAYPQVGLSNAFRTGNTYRVEFSFEAHAIILKLRKL